MIAFDRVVARYPGAVLPAVDGVSLTAVPGVLTAVVGPNGSGKSTLVRTLLGRVPVVSGTVTLGTRGLSTLNRREVAQYAAVVVQREEPVFPMRVRDYVSLGRHPVLGSWARDPSSDTAVADAARVAGVEPLLLRTTDRLSGGEWQRVRIARALAQRTPAIVMDEPTTALDVGHEMEAFELLDRLASEGRTVLVVSHQLNLVVRFAKHIVLLHEGRVAAAGAPDDVMQAHVLQPVYQWPLAVTHDPVTGAVSLIPLRRPPSPRG